MESTGLLLRDYQETAISAASIARAQGITSMLVVMPTGAGKTIFFSELTRRWGARTLVLEHRDELIRQTVEKFRWVLGPAVPIGVVQGTTREWQAPILVGSVQTVTRHVAELPPLDVLIVDEAHHSPAPSYSRIVDAIRATNPDVLIVGVTATPERLDGVPLVGTEAAIFQRMVYQKKLTDLQRDGYLVPLRGQSVPLHASLRGLRRRDGDYLLADLKKLNTTDRNIEIADAIVHNAIDRRGIVFTVSVDAAYAMAALLSERGIPAQAIVGETPYEERQAAYQSLRSGTLQYLTTVEVLTEGFDEPCVDCIVMARPTQSTALYTQMAGRGARLYPDKMECLILDCVDRDSESVVLDDIVPPVFTQFLLKNLLSPAEYEDRYPAAPAVPEELTECGPLNDGVTRSRPLAWAVAEPQKGVRVYVLAVTAAAQIWVAPVVHGDAQDAYWVSVCRTRYTMGQATVHWSLAIPYSMGLAWAVTRAETVARQIASMQASAIQWPLADLRLSWHRQPMSAEQAYTLQRWGVTPSPRWTKGDAARRLDQVVAVARWSAYKATAQSWARPPVVQPKPQRLLPRFAEELT